MKRRSFLSAGVAGTQKGWNVYVHVLDPEVPEVLPLPGTGDLTIGQARRFDTGTEVSLSHHGNSPVELQLPRSERDPTDTLIVLELAG